MCLRVGWSWTLRVQVKMNMPRNNSWIQFCWKINYNFYAIDTNLRNTFYEDACIIRLGKSHKLWYTWKQVVYPTS